MTDWDRIARELHAAGWSLEASGIAALRQREQDAALSPLLSPGEQRWLATGEGRAPVDRRLWGKHPELFRGRAA